MGLYRLILIYTVYTDFITYSIMNLSEVTCGQNRIFNSIVNARTVFICVDSICRVSWPHAWSLFTFLCICPNCLIVASAKRDV